MNGAPSPVQMDDTMFNLTNSVICRVAFGTSRKGNQFENGQIKEILADSMILLSGFSVSDLFPSSVGWIIDLITGLHSKLERCFRNFDAFFQKVLDEHLDPSRLKPENDDIIDVMLGLAQDRTTVLKLNKYHIKAILVDIFLGAVDTSSCTSVWLMAELARNPGVMKKPEEINMEDEFGLNIRKKVPLYLVPVKYNWEGYKT
ncbi:unnamed protein product [Fraxinus pennsylvanica]|uniref:Cytochrome P450 n=1 Tax=Fraxinus pennsylvanica TaxID=56036 RepID=A0AAD1ZPG5_9LAMI|nr:unnamed protein product [Fraxinus pennsylvanica]